MVMSGIPCHVKRFDRLVYSAIGPTLLPESKSLSLMTNMVIEEMDPMSTLNFESIRMRVRANLLGMASGGYIRLSEVTDDSDTWYTLEKLKRLPDD